MLTDIAVRKAKPHAKPRKLTDGGGLHLFVTPAGGKFWRWRYEFERKEKVLSLGSYPAMSIADARAARDQAKATLRAGTDPSVAKRIQRAVVVQANATTFETVARDWYHRQKPIWTATHAADVIGSLERDVFPTIGAVPIHLISVADVLSLLRKIEARPAIETAHRIRQRMSAVFLFGISSGICENDPAANVKTALSPVVKGRQPAVTSLVEARKIITTSEATPAHAITKLAHRLLALTTVRPGTLLTTPWTEFENLEPKNPVWHIPAQRMKLRLKFKDDETKDHFVPLSRQAVEVIEVLRTLSGSGPLAFPNTRFAHKPLSENAIGYYLNRAGYHGRHVPHGWRATFSTVMNERYPADRYTIDLMLAHVAKDKVEAAYNRAAHMPRRVELAQAWADLILEGAPPASSLLDGPCR